MQERHSDFGSFLKAWRKFRNMTQSELADRLHISSRHLSFIENNHVAPNRECVDAITSALNIPPQEVIVALGVAGLPVYQTGNIDDEYLKGYKSSLEFVIHQLNPFPVWVFGNKLETVARNTAHIKKWAVIEEELGGLVTHDLLDMFFHPEGLRRCIVNWQDPARHILKLIQLGSLYGNPDFKERLKRTLEFPDIKKLVYDAIPQSNPSPLVTQTYKLKGELVTFKAGPLLLGSIMDRAAYGFNLVCYFPADEQSDAFCRKYFV